MQQNAQSRKHHPPELPIATALRHLTGSDLPQHDAETEHAQTERPCSQMRAKSLHIAAKGDGLATLHGSLHFPVHALKAALVLGTRQEGLPKQVLL
jgi:hypothetical protein